MPEIFTIEPDTLAASLDPLPAALVAFKPFPTFPTRVSEIGGGDLVPPFRQLTDEQPHENLAAEQALPPKRGIRRARH